MNDISNQFVSWLLIIIGWVIINKQHNSRELRKEIRIVIDHIIEQINELELLAVEYHMKQRSLDAESKIKKLIKSIEFTIEIHKILPIGIGNERIIALRRSITLNNFETSKYLKKSFESEDIKDIQWYATELIQSIEHHYRVRYPL